MTIYHPDVNKPYFYDCIQFNGQFYAGTVKDGVARLYSDPLNPTKIDLVVKVKDMKHTSIRDGGDTEILVLEGEVIEE